MSSRLENGLIFVKEMPNCVSRISLLDDGGIACSTQSRLHILDSKGNEVFRKNDIPENFALTPDNERVLFLKYEKREHFIESLDLKSGKIKTEKKLRIKPCSPEFFFSYDLDNIPDSFVVVATNKSRPNKAKVYEFATDLELKRCSRALPCGEYVRNAFISQTSPLEIFASMENRTLYSISNGLINWKMECPKMIDGCDEFNRTLVVGSKHGNYVKAFELDNEHRKPSKEPIWTHDSIGQVMAVLIPDGRTALVGTENLGGRLYAFDLKTGEEKFRHEMTKDFGIWTIKHANGTIYLGTGIGGKGRVYALDYKALGLDK